MVEIDSRATRHVVKTNEGVMEFQELKREKHINMENNIYLDVKGIDSCRLDLDNTVVLKDVFYVLDIRRNLIYVSVYLKKGLEVIFHNNRVSIRKDKKEFSMDKFVPKHNLFCLFVVSVANNESLNLNYFVF